jgi:mannosyltransferase OCH1-like enzyme
MDTWKQILADYEFILWDSKRFDINSVLWVKQAFETELYAFAADYIRLYAVYNLGGIYLDMDMEAVKPFDELLNSDIMLAYEHDYFGDEEIEAGCFGAAKGHPYIKKCMEYYEQTPMLPDSRMPEIMKLNRSERHSAIKPLTAPAVLKSVLKEYFPNANYRHIRQDRLLLSIQYYFGRFFLKKFPMPMISKKSRYNRIDGL